MKALQLAMLYKPDKKPDDQLEGQTSVPDHLLHKSQLSCWQTLAGSWLETHCCDAQSESPRQPLLQNAPYVLWLLTIT